MPVRCLAAAMIAATSLPAAAVERPARETGTVFLRDRAGDANLGNDQGLEAVPIPDDAPTGTRPASIDPADIVEGRLRTTYAVHEDRDQQGRLVWIRHVATGIRVILRTYAPASPTFGPTVLFELRLRTGACDLRVSIAAPGPRSAPEDPTGAVVGTGDACIGGARTYAEGIDVAFPGQATVVDIPFAALEPPTGGRVLGLGSPVGPAGAKGGARAYPVRGLAGGTVLAGPILDKAVITEPFVIGSDLPADVDCLATPVHHRCAEVPSFDTGEDLHDALLASGAPARTAHGGTIDLAREFGVYSFRPDGRWMTFGFDVAGFEESYVEINLAARLIRDGVVSEEWLPISESFASWKLIYGPDDDPHRTMSSVTQDTPYGVTLALPTQELDRLTLLAGSHVASDEDVGFVIAMHGTEEPFFGEPFPDDWASWISSWTAGKSKTRLIADRGGSGVEMAAASWEHGGLAPSDRRRGVEVSDDRTRVGSVAAPGSVRITGTLVAPSASLVETSLFYTAAGKQDITLRWTTPTGGWSGRREAGEGSGASLFATSTDGGAGAYSTALEIDSDVETSSSLGFYQDLWRLDPDKLFPGLQNRLVGDPALSPAAVAFLRPGRRFPGPAPRRIVTSAQA